MKALIAGIAPVLNFNNRNLALPPMAYLDVNPHPPNSFVERCKGVLTNFKAYIHGVACTVAGHALAVVRSLYLAVSLEVIDGGFAEGAEDAEVGQLTEEAMESTLKLIEDLDIFDDRGQNHNN
jgi:hypothetical protein